MGRICPDMPTLFGHKDDEPTADTWVKNENGKKVRVAVVNMEDAHLWRWIRYFRKKYRDSGFQGDDALLDEVIRQSMVTAPAIYAEAEKRGVMNLQKAPAEPPKFVKLRVLEFLSANYPETYRIVSKADPVIQESAQGLVFVFAATEHRAAEALSPFRGTLESIARGISGRRQQTVVILVEAAKTTATKTKPDAAGTGVRRITLDEDV